MVSMTISCYYKLAFFFSCINATVKASVNCENPTTLLDDSPIDIIVLAYSGTARGSSVTFSCSPGLVLTGPNSSTCMGNGEWEPDPRKAICKGESSKTSKS